jgi:tetratricopeptide (TPR) repeat protein
VLVRVKVRVTGSWAKKISEKSNVTAGVSLKYLQSKLAGYSASSPMLDLGVAYPLQNPKYRGLRLAAALRNMGPALKYDREGSPLPQQLVMGGALSSLGGNLNIGLDFIKPKDSNAYIATGIEYRLFDMLMVRAGYNGLSNFVGNGITYGMGLKFRQWNLDYAFVPYGDLGNTNRVSVSIRFGHALEMQKADDAVEFSYQRAEQQLALGHPVEAYSSLIQLLEIAPWHKPSVELKAKIEKQFEEMSVSKNRAKFEAEISEKFTEAKAHFDREELVDAKKGFELILKLQPDHVGSKVYLERIQGRYTALADDSFKQGMAFYAVNDYAQAKVLFEKTLTIDPNYKDAKAQLEKTIQMMEDSTRREKEMALLAGAADGKVYVRIDVDDAWADAVRSSVQGWVAGWASQG